MNCFEGTNTPAFESAPCEGNPISDLCVFREGGIPYLDVEPNTDLDTILNKIVASLMAKDELLVQASQDSRPYTSYTALLTQSGIDAPEVTDGVPLEDTLSNTPGNVVWTRLSPGLYRGTTAGLLTEGRTVVFFNGTYQGDNIRQEASLDVAPNSVFITTTDGGTPIDDILNGNIEIRVYNL